MNIGYNPHLGYEADVIRDYNKAVHSIAVKFRTSLNGGIDYEDLISVGNLGLLEAFRNYDPDRFNGKVTSFSTYAFPMIKWSIQRFLRDKRYSVRIPRSIQARVTTILKQGWELETKEAISEKSGWSLTEIEEARQFLDGWSVTSLDQSLSAPNLDEISLLDLIPSADDSSGIFVEEFISLLNRTEKMILTMRLTGQTQGDISAKVDFSQAHISRILKRIGEKYYMFQTGTLKKEKEDLIMARPKKESSFSQVGEFNKIEWFVDEAVPTNPTAGLNTQGIHFNRRAIHETGWKPGQCLQVGYDAAENKLILRASTNGLKLRTISGDKNGGLRLVNKRLSAWIKQKDLDLKRYALRADSNGFHYIDFSA